MQFGVFLEHLIGENGAVDCITTLQQFIRNVALVKVSAEYHPFYRKDGIIYNAEAQAANRWPVWPELSESGQERFRFNVLPTYDLGESFYDEKQTLIN